jgi:phenylacetate-CoA ligase
MSIYFKVKEFAYPVEILKLRLFLEKSQWFSEEKLKNYQLERLRLVLEHAYLNVPYYRSLFQKLRLTPQDFNDLEDLKKIPTLTRETLRINFNELVAENAKKFKPVLFKTSGSTGNPTEFYLDKRSNALEFCYYWRYWSWAGYKLGMSFAEFSIHHFLASATARIYDYSFMTKRLILNPTQLSDKNIHQFAEKIKKYKPLFLKGAPSTLYIFSLLLEKSGYGDLSFKAVFTTGEKVILQQREAIERIFKCKVLDSYGHMERIVAISQCPLGSYHINSDYGILEVEKSDKFIDVGGNVVGEAIGTSLYNFSMPLIRYKIGDLLEIDRGGQRCACGRVLPLVKNIFGRTQDVILTPSGRYLTNIFVIFNFIDGILSYKIYQKSRDELIIKVAKDAKTSDEVVSQKLIAYFKKIIGEEINIKIEFLPLESFSSLNKHKVVESDIEVKI